MPTRSVGEKAEHLMEQIPNFQSLTVLAQIAERLFEQIENFRLFEIPAEDAQAPTTCQRIWCRFYFAQGSRKPMFGQGNSFHVMCDGLLLLADSP